MSVSDFSLDGQYDDSASTDIPSGRSYPCIGRMDRFPEPLVADFCLFGRPCGGDSSDGDMSVEPLLPPHGRGDHPVFRPEKSKCIWCKQRGHTLLFCSERLKHCERMREVNCCKGYHMPHLHDDVDIWRCQWCGTHMRSSYVRYHYPNTYAFEREKCEENLNRAWRNYGN